MIALFEENQNENVILKNLNNIEEIREIAQMKELAYKKKMKKHNDSRVIPKLLNLGDLVLRNAQMTMSEQNRGKLS